MTLDRDLAVELHDVFQVMQLTRDTPLESLVGVDLVSLEPGQTSQIHRHNRAETVLYMLDGAGVVVIDDTDHAVTAGDRVRIPAGAFHGVRTGDALAALPVRAVAADPRREHRRVGPRAEMMRSPATPADVGPFLSRYLPYLLQRADQLMSRRFHADLQAAGIGVSEWRVLAVLLDDGELPLSVLAGATMLPQPTTTHAVARLEVAGHVARRTGAVRPSPAHRRPDTCGALARRGARGDRRRRERDVLAALPPHDVARLRDEIALLTDSLLAATW